MFIWTARDASGTVDYVLIWRASGTKTGEVFVMG